MSDTHDDLEGTAMSGFVDILSATIMMFMFFVLLTAVALFFHVLTFTSKEAPVSPKEVAEVKQLVVVLEEENQKLREQVEGLNEKSTEIDATFKETNGEQRIFISPDGMRFVVFFGVNSITVTETTRQEIKSFIDKAIGAHGTALTATMTSPKTRSNIASVARKVAIARILNTRNSLLDTALPREAIKLEVKPPEAFDGDDNWTMIQLQRR